ncbi:hypothetical protein TKK_0005805 [Trichogramma kaykai]
MDNCEYTSKDFHFALVEFVHKGRRKKIEAIDVVPTEWITFNKVKKRYSAQFLPPPYNEDRCALLQTFVKQQMDAPEDWPSYTVKLKGRANTYEEAVIKLKDLQTEASAFTADSDDGDNDSRKQLENQIKRAKLLSAQATVIEQLKAKDNLQNDDIMDTSQEETAYPKKSDDSSLTIDVFAPSCSKMMTESTEKRNDYVPMDSIVLSTGDAEDSNAIIPASIEFESVFYKEIVSKLNEIQGEIKVLNNKQDEIIRFMAGKEVVSTLQGKSNLQKKYNVDIPFSLLSNFTAFDEKLLNNDLMRKDVSEYVTTLVYKDLSISKSFVNMLKDFFLKTVAMNFTTNRASKKNPRKN